MYLTSLIGIIVCMSSNFYKLLLMFTKNFLDFKQVFLLTFSDLKKKFSIHIAHEKKNGFQDNVRNAASSNGHFLKTNYQKGISQIIFFEWVNQNKIKKLTKPYLTHEKKSKKPEENYWKPNKIRTHEKMGKKILKNWKNHEKTKNYDETTKKNCDKRKKIVKKEKILWIN